MIKSQFSYEKLINSGSAYYPAPEKTLSHCPPNAPTHPKDKAAPSIQYFAFGQLVRPLVAVHLKVVWGQHIA